MATAGLPHCRAAFPVNNQRGLWRGTVAGGYPVSPSPVSHDFGIHWWLTITLEITNRWFSNSVFSSTLVSLHSSVKKRKKKKKKRKKNSLSTGIELYSSFWRSRVNYSYWCWNCLIFGWQVLLQVGSRVLLTNTSGPWALLCFLRKKKKTPATHLCFLSSALGSTILALGCYSKKLASELFCLDQIQVCVTLGLFLSPFWVRLSSCEQWGSWILP